MTTHLDEIALEALAHDRADLVSAEQSAHVDACPECARAVDEARSLSRGTGAAFCRVSTDAVDLDALVRTAVATVAPAPRASRRSLLVGGLLAAPLAVVFGFASFLESVGVGSALDGAHAARTIAFTLARLVVVHVTPEIGGTIAAVGAVLVALLLLVMRALVGGAAPVRRAAVEVVR